MVLVLQCDAFVVIILSDEPRQNQGRGLVDRKPRRLFCFGSLVVLDVVCGYFLLLLLDIKYKIGKNICLMLG